jgi:hypothetical protein
VTFIVTIQKCLIREQESHLSTLKADGVQRSPLGGRRPHTSTCVSVGYQAARLLVTIVLSSLFTLYIQTWIPTSTLPLSIRQLFQPICTHVTVNNPPFFPFFAVSDSRRVIPFNYGLKQCGAQVIEELTFGKTRLPAPGQPHSELFVGDDTTLSSTSGGPDSALSGDVSSATCWEFHGHQGQLGFSTVELLEITSVSIGGDDNTPYPIDSAPHTLVLWGVIDGQEMLDRYHTRKDLRSQLHSYLPGGVDPPQPKEHNYVPLAVLQYNPHLADLQQFASVFRDAKGLGMPFGIVVLQIIDNWGANSTRLCGVGIHGLPRNAGA